MTNKPLCSNDPRHGESVFIIDGGQRYLCSECGHAHYQRVYDRRQPVGVARGSVT